MSKSNRDNRTKEMVFETIVFELLKQDNPDLIWNYSDNDFENNVRRYYDAVAFNVLNLNAFEMERIKGERIVIELKTYRPSTDSLSAFVIREENNFDVIVFIIGSKVPNDVKEKINSEKCRIVFITKDELNRNSLFKQAYKDPEESLKNDNNILIEDNYPLLMQTKENLSFALGAGCSRSSSISDWKTLSKALGYELLYEVVDTRDSKYKNMKIADQLNTDIFECFDNNSALDAIQNSFITTTSNSSNNSYWLAIKNVLYMAYDKPDTSNGSLMASIVSCIYRRKIKSIINYNFDSVLEQSMDPSYKSTAKEITTSKTEINNCEIYHVHGYIPFDYDGKADVSNFIFTDKEYYDNTINPTSFTNHVQNDILRNKNVIFVGVSFTDQNMKEILRERAKARCNNTVFAFLKLPEFKFEGTNNKLIENKYKLIFQQYFRSLGVKILWVHDFNEIPQKIDLI